MPSPDEVRFCFEVEQPYKAPIVLSGSISMFTVEEASRAGSAYLEDYLFTAFGAAIREITAKISEPVRQREREDLERLRTFSTLAAAIARDNIRKETEGDHR